MSFAKYLIKHMAWSRKTFGHGKFQKDRLDLIRRKLMLVEKHEHNNGLCPFEWADIVALSIDGLTRQLSYTNVEPDEDIRDPRDTAYTACQIIKYSKSVNNMGVTKCTTSNSK